MHKLQRSNSMDIQVKDTITLAMTAATSNAQGVKDRLVEFLVYHAITLDASNRQNKFFAPLLTPPLA